MFLKSYDFQCDFDFQIITCKIILILYHLYLGDLIFILKSSTYDFAHPCLYLLVMFLQLTIGNETIIRNEKSFYV